MTQSLKKRLRPETQRALGATVRYDTGTGWGTAFVVQRDGREVLAFTNNHVTKSKGPGARLEFLKANAFGTVRVAVAQVESVLATSPELDYSLVRARLRDDLDFEPLSISSRPLRPREKIVAMGFPRAAQWTRTGRYDQTPREKRQVANGVYDNHHQYVQVGSELGGGEIRLLQDPDPRIANRSPHPVWSVALNTTSAGGASGSPILSAEDHKVRAIHWTSGGTFPRSELRLNDPHFVWSNAAFAVPMSRILEDLGRQLSDGRVPSFGRAAVDRLIRSAAE